MDIYSFNRAKNIQEKLRDLRTEKEIWEGASGLCSGVQVWNGCTKCEIRISRIDFEELKNKTLEYINSKINALEEEFKRL